SPPLGHPIFPRLPTCPRGRGGSRAGRPLGPKGSLGRADSIAAPDHPWPPIKARRWILETSQRRFAKSSPAPSRTQSSRQLPGRLALTVAQNLGIAAERIHDYGRDEFDTR